MSRTPEEALQQPRMYSVKQNALRRHAMEGYSRQAFGFTTTKKKGLLQALNGPLCVLTAPPKRVMNEYLQKD